MEGTEWRILRSHGRRSMPNPRDPLARPARTLLPRTSSELPRWSLPRNLMVSCLADGMLFGALGKCPLCGGGLEYAGGRYRCRGFLTAWSKCAFSTTDPERIKGKWKIPEGTDNEYLCQWFKSQKGKKPIRVLPPKSSNKSSENQGAMEHSQAVQSAPLQGLAVTVVGNLKESLMWNHAECILKQRGQFHTVDDLEGFDALQFEDQEKIRKYLNDLAGCFATNIYASPTIDGLDESTIEKSKSSRATCKSCNQKIVKGEVRISTTSDPDNPWVRGTLPAWRHAKCFLEMGWWTNAMEKMSGWDSLISEDKQAVQRIAEPYIQDGKLESKQEAGQPLERPCQSSNISEGSKIIDEASIEGKGKKRKTAESKTLHGKNENIGASTNNRARKLDGDLGEGSAAKAAELEEKLKDQTKVTWTIKDSTQKSGVISVILEGTFQDSR